MEFNRRLQCYKINHVQDIQKNSFNYVTRTHNAQNRESIQFAKQQTDRIPAPTISQIIKRIKRKGTFQTSSTPTKSDRPKSRHHNQAKIITTPWTRRCHSHPANRQTNCRLQ